MNVLPRRFRHPSAPTSLGMRAARTLAGIVMVAVLGACGPVQAGASHAGQPHVTRVSLFSYPWIWTDENGHAVRFADWRGRPLVVAAFYASCRSTCPRTVRQMRKIQNSPEGRASQFLLVTLDPIADSPELLRRYKESEGLPSTWHLLAGSASQTQDLADALDIHVMAMDSHRFHDGRIVLFDSHGMPTHSFSGWAVDEEAPVAVLGCREP